MTQTYVCKETIVYFQKVNDTWILLFKFGHTVESHCSSKFDHKLEIERQKWRKSNKEIHFYLLRLSDVSLWWYMQPRDLGSWLWLKSEHCLSSHLKTRNYVSCRAFNPTNCTMNNKLSLVIYDIPPTQFDLYKASSGRRFTNEYKYNKLCRKTCKCGDNI